MLASLAFAQQNNDCSSKLIVKSQDDVERVSGCEEFSGDVILADELSGKLDLYGLFTREGPGGGSGYATSFSGNITNVECSDDDDNDDSCHVHKPGLTDLIIYSYHVDTISLHEMPKLASLVFTNTFTFKHFTLSDLPELQNVTVTTDGPTFDSQVRGLASERELHLSHLPKLESISPDDVLLIRGNVTLDRVTLQATPLNFYYNNDNEAVRELKIQDDKHIEHLSLLRKDAAEAKTDLFSSDSHQMLRNFTFVGTGNTSLSVRPLSVDNEELLSLPAPWNISISRLSSLEYIDSDWDDLRAGDFHIYDTRIEELELRLKKVTRLRITDNPVLKTIRFGRNSEKFEYKEIDISRNPMLKLEASYGPKRYDDGGRPLDSVQDGHDTFYWPVHNVKKMTFQGDFDSAFL